MIMKDVTIEDLTKILRDQLKAAGCPTADVKVQRMNDPAVPSNWHYADWFSPKDDDPNDVRSVLDRIVLELQKQYRLV
jgi:hypothetical protein